MQRNQWYSCKIFIIADNQWRVYILWNYYILRFTIILFLVPLWKTLNSHKFNEKMQGINPVGPSDPLVDSYPNSCPETPNYHPKLGMISLKFWKGLTQWDVLPFWSTLIPTTVIENQTVTKTLIWLPWREGRTNSIDLTIPLNDSKTNNCSETPNSYQNIESIYLN